MKHFRSVVGRTNGDEGRELLSYHRDLRLSLAIPKDQQRRAIVALHRSHGYGQTDIAIMLGLTKERVRQILNEAGVNRGAEAYGSMPRVWDDRRNRFVPRTRQSMAREHHRTAAIHRIRQRAVRQIERRNNQLAILRPLCQQLGRTPTIIEMCRALGYPRQPTQLLIPWRPVGMAIRLTDYGTRNGRAAWRYRELCRALGVAPRSTGAPGHIEASPPGAQPESERV